MVLILSGPKSDIGEHCIFRFQISPKAFPSFRVKTFDTSEDGTFKWMLTLPGAKIVLWVVLKSDEDLLIALMSSRNGLFIYSCDIFSLIQMVLRYCPNSDSRRTIKDSMAELIASFYCLSRLKSLPDHMNHVIFIIKR